MNPELYEVAWEAYRAKRFVLIGVDRGDWESVSEKFPEETECFRAAIDAAVQHVASVVAT